MDDKQGIARLNNFLLNHEFSKYVDYEIHQYEMNYTKDMIEVDITQNGVRGWMSIPCSEFDNFQISLLEDPPLTFEHPTEVDFSVEIVPGSLKTYVDPNEKKSSYQEFDIGCDYAGCQNIAKYKRKKNAPEYAYPKSVQKICSRHFDDNPDFFKYLFEPIEEEEQCENGSKTPPKDSFLFQYTTSAVFEFEPGTKPQTIEIPPPNSEDGWELIHDRKPKWKDDWRANNVKLDGFTFDVLYRTYGKNQVQSECNINHLPGQLILKEFIDLFQLREPNVKVLSYSIYRRPVPLAIPYRVEFESRIYYDGDWPERHPPRVIMESKK